MSDPIAPTTVTPPAADPAAPAPTTKASTSFVDYLDTALAGLDVKKAADPEAPVAPAAAAVADPAAPLFPEAAVVAPVPPAPGEVDTLREQHLDDLFKTKAGQAFQELKTDLRTSRQKHADEVAQLRKEIEESRKGLVPATEIESLRREKEARDLEVAEYEQELALSRVEATKAYKESVAKPLATIRSTIADIARSGDLRAADITAALDTTDPVEQDRLIAEIAAAVPERQRFTLYNLLPQYRQVVEQEKFVRENARTALQLIEERTQAETQRSRAASEQAYTQALDASWGELQEKVPFFRPVEGNDQWNSTLTELQTTARATKVGELPAAEQAQMVYHSRALPLALNALQHYANQAAQLEAKLKGYESGSPLPGGGNPGTGSIDGKKPVSAGGFLDAVG